MFRRSLLFNQIDCAGAGFERGHVLRCLASDLAFSAAGHLQPSTIATRNVYRSEGLIDGPFPFERQEKVRCPMCVSGGAKYLMLVLLECRYP